MERIDLANLHDVLGISPPWHISSIELDKVNRIANIHVEANEKKKLFGLIDTHKQSPNKPSGRWAYMPMGNFRCIVHGDTPETENTHAISLAQINLPAFIGDSQRNYSNYVRQQVALAELKGIPGSAICEALHIEQDVYLKIKQDLDSASAQAKSLAFLPTEIDNAWLKVLTDQIIVKTNLLPLKLLLSKLKLATAKASDTVDVSQYCRDLRQFFIANIHLMDTELDQVCGITNEKMRRQVSAKKQRQKLVLPALKNPVWIDLLTGRLNLNSQSVPLNLLISRQRVAFLQGKDGASRVSAIETLREYVKRNYRTLKPELVLINRAISINEKTKLRLPNPDHAIWQHILSDDKLVPSEHVAYKLLLAKLRVQINNAQDPVVRLEAARSIRSFMQLNQKTMRRELTAIVKKLQAS